MSHPAVSAYAYFATCPKGLETLLLEELRSLGASKVKETVAGVYFDGPLSIAYRSCLWSRLANRILMPLSQDECRNTDDLYAAVKALPWEQHLAVDGSFAIDFSGAMPGLKHPHFAALKAKDAIADYFTERFERRPDVNKDHPGIRVNIRVAKGVLVTSLDLSGESLHRRGYRQEGGAAPLKENLAAAILMRANWSGIAARGGALLDPMCGSGTLLIEGAMMSANIAPGILRSYWGFNGWLGHQSKYWDAELQEARALKEAALQRQWPEIRGYDASPKAIDIAQQNIDAAGLNGKVRVLRKELADFAKPTHVEIDSGLVICNPPYGERLGDESSLLHLYRNLGQTLKKEFVGWQAGVFTGNPELGKKMGLKNKKQYQLFNGAIASKLLSFDVQPEYFVEDRRALTERDEKSSVPQPLSDGAQMFANRLRKNRKQLQKWAKNNNVSCYRLYDADMPEYAVAVDYYEGWVHVAEYSAPASVDPAVAEQRLREVMSAIPQALDVAEKYVVLKQRTRQKGAKQYQKQDSSGDFFEVREGQAKLLVNMKDYLDTGLFLDHRPVRLKIAELAKGNRFLNLFCYTATASVHAAMGGATFTDSVDLSSTYLEWASKNMALNGFSETKHRMIRADVLEWVKTCDNRYDLILLDPPTFSNSKKMDATLDIQRDHVALIHDAMKLLTRDGLLIFSNNQRKFSLANDQLTDYCVENKSDWSLDKDFHRSKKIHQCWFIKHQEK
ncbi:bifunctional 23S rRNA (guanine(2069)-N(7))-methyltransferase RlmK/23S rRNA (guanine(2445)-N(2))-methyltransferase RlmL [Oceanicoccus sp. KOV_DT_Chl]|uniref:bifunctional 23S rRNA (guanine(2069)-N(7))-methyltransferase RlmK/23S rRNA (guanine(2445)-N(2))-methyltransferase RlmL n=1 Tax=Oceanicoccus sp. KOV_DT_Chl TaxID=1904639 RepID=UPI000C797670|nr:bifunctional 23S rRNA (guanine(2069)-N(7))-methyltransferase RlmK/23S rRNA (guanine(2445)-N(2))-methyltransferase RlmL [Oceanicoccus sp. KOV_DT_Chl]